MKNKTGFTLIEIIITMGVFILLVLGSMIAYSSARERVNIDTTNVQLDQLLASIKLLELDTKLWPGNGSPQTPYTLACSGGANEVWDLTVDSAGLLATDGNFTNWGGPYIAEIPLDPWGNPYFFDSDYVVDGEQAVVLGSFGPNGVGQNLYDSDDIIRILYQGPCP